MLSEKIKPAAPEVEQKKKFRVTAEMEAWGINGEPITDSALWEELTIAVDPDLDETAIDDAIVDKLFEMDFGNRRPTGSFEKEEVE